MLQYTFTATPVKGGSPVVVTRTTPEATFTGLQPGTEYQVKVTGRLASGATSPASNTLNFVTPASG